MTGKITVLNLRQASGGGGGADAVIFNTAAHIDSGPFAFMVAYLRKYDEDISPISERLKACGIPYFEFPGGKIFNVKQFLAIAGIVRKHNVRVVHCHDPKTDMYGYLLKILFPELKFVSTVHGWITRRWRSALYNKLDLFFLRRFDAVIAVSGHTEQIAKGYGIRGTCLIHNSIDLRKWQPEKKAVMPVNAAESRRPFCVGFIGRISKEKGPLDFVHVAQKVFRQDGNCEFVVAGEGAEKEAMLRLVKQLNLENKFRFTGLLSQGQLYGLYQHIDVLLLTSYTEGIPLTIMEACAMNVPVAATRVGGVSEIIRDGYTGLLASSGDIDALAACVLKIKNDYDLAERLRNNGRITVEKEFSLDAGIKKLEEVYKTVVV